MRSDTFIPLQVGKNLLFARVPVGKVEELIRLIQNSLEPESISTPWKLNQRFPEFQFRSFFLKEEIQPPERTTKLFLPRLFVLEFRVRHPCTL